MVCEHCKEENEGDDDMCVCGFERQWHPVVKEKPKKESKDDEKSKQSWGYEN